MSNPRKSKYNCDECGMRLSSEDAEMGDGVCESCRWGTLGQEVLDENWDDDYDEYERN